MKRICSFLLVLTMMFSLAACSNAHDPHRVTLAEADFVPTEAAVVLPDEITFDKLTVYEGDDFTIAISSLDPDAPRRLYFGSFSG